MKERSAVVILTTATITALTLSAWMRARQLQQIHAAVEQNLAATQDLQRDLGRIRGALNQVHQYLVPKGVKKAAF